MRKIWGLLLLAVMVVSCGDSAQKVERHSKAERARLHREDSLALKIAVTPTLDALPIFVAKEQRLFDSLGVDVRLRQYNAQMECDTALMGGSVEGAVTDLVRADRMMKKGVSLRYTAATNAYWQLISNRLARVKRINQLGDKMIAMTRFSATDLLADLAIDSGKPKNTVFKVQINDLNIRLHMLQNNEMDAMFLPEPWATTARLYQNPVLMDSRDKDIRLGVVAFRNQAMTDARRKKQLNAFVKGYNQACDSINKNGVAYYEKVIYQYCKADSRTIQALPKQHYSHAAAPRQKDVERAKSFLK